MESLLEYLKKEREQEWRVELRGTMKNKERNQPGAAGNAGRGA